MRRSAKVNPLSQGSQGPDEDVPPSPGLFHFRQRKGAAGNRPATPSCAGEPLAGKEENREPHRLNPAYGDMGAYRGSGNAAFRRSCAG
jgi:hypothetical protein